MNNGEKKELSIYIHIPFCLKKCSYCDFPSGVYNEDIQKKYFEKINYEIQMFSEKANNYVVKTIFIGGGTPSAVDSSYIEEIMETIDKVFFLKNRINRNTDFDLEYTIEINPGTVDSKKLLAYQKMGINRLSFGLQSCKDEELLKLGRIHNYSSFVDNYNLARKLGFHNINIDFMSALPGQTVAGYMEGIQTIVNLKPQHISCYSLIIEEGTPFYTIREQLSLPTEEEERRMYWETVGYLKKHGYFHYEISNFARQGMKCQHNCTYWNLGEYVGFGLGAASFMENTRYSNTSKMEEYLYEKEFLKDKSGLLSKNNQMEEFVFLGLRQIDGIRKKEFWNRFHINIEEIYRKVLDKYIESQLLFEDNEKVKLTEKGIDVCNLIFSDFLL